MANVIEPPVFDDRYDAGRELAERLQDLESPQTVVVGLVRGGVPVAYSIAALLQCQLEITVARPIPVPSDPTLSLGAVGEDGRAVIDEPLLARLGSDRHDIAQLVAPARQQSVQDATLYRDGRPRAALTGRPVILADDGTGLGYDLLAAANFVASAKPSALILAMPVAAADVLRQVQRVVTDSVVLVIRHDSTFSVPGFYRNWEEVSDDQILRLLRDAVRWRN